MRTTPPRRLLAAGLAGDLVKIRIITRHAGHRTQRTAWTTRSDLPTIASGRGMIDIATSDPSTWQPIQLAPRHRTAKILN